MMLLKLLENSETDIISALEQKCARGDAAVSFAQDPRVRNALIVFSEHSYEYVHGGCNFDFVEYLDDMWVASYLLREIGDSKQSDEMRKGLLKYFNPFTAYHPVTRVYAYCEAIECAETIDALDCVVGGMNSCLGNSGLQIIKDAYPRLRRIAESRRSYLEKRAEYERQVSEEVFNLVWAADDLVRNWDFSEASKKYERAEELARYQLRDEALAGWVKDRMKEVSNECITQEDAGPVGPEGDYEVCDYDEDDCEDTAEDDSKDDCADDSQYEKPPDKDAA